LFKSLKMIMLKLLREKEYVGMIFFLKGCMNENDLSRQQRDDSGSA